MKKFDLQANGYKLGDIIHYYKITYLRGLGSRSTYVAHGRTEQEAINNFRIAVGGYIVNIKKQ